MLKPPETEVLGKVVEHARSDKTGKFITRFSNVPDLDFVTWLKSNDEELQIWVAKPRKWFGSEAKTPPFIFLLSIYEKGYVRISRAIIKPYNNEIFEQENQLGFNSL